MREIILADIKKMLKVLAVVTVMIVIYLLAYGHSGLIIGVIVGYMTGAVWYGVMLGRLWRSADMTVSQAKSTMATGLILRLVMLAAVFGVAVQISVEQFAAVVAGFAIIYVLGLLLLIRTNYRKYL